GPARARARAYRGHARSDPRRAQAPGSPGAREGVREIRRRLRFRRPQGEVLGCVRRSPATALAGGPGRLRQGVRARLRLGLSRAAASAEVRALALVIRPILYENTVWAPSRKFCSGIRSGAGLRLPKARKPCRAALPPLTPSF